MLGSLQTITGPQEKANVQARPCAEAGFTRREGGAFVPASAPLPSESPWGLRPPQTFPSVSNGSSSTRNCCLPHLRAHQFNPPHWAGPRFSAQGMEETNEVSSKDDSYLCLPSNSKSSAGLSMKSHRYLHSLGPAPHPCLLLWQEKQLPQVHPNRMSGGTGPADIRSD